MTDIEHRDAFGNPTTGAGSDAEPAYQPLPGDPLRIDPGAAPAPMPLPPRRSAYTRVPAGIAAGMIARPRIVLRLVWLVVVLAVVGIPVLSVFHGYDQIFDSFRNGFGASPTAPAAPTGLAGASMLRTANVRETLRQVRVVAPNSRPNLIRVDASRVDVRVKSPDGIVRTYTRDWNRGWPNLSSTRSGSRSLPTMRWSGIDPGVPARLFDGVRNGSTQPAKQLSYAVLLAGAGAWVGYRVDGTGFDGGRHGIHIDRRP